MQDVERVVQAPIFGNDNIPIDLHGHHDQRKNNGHRNQEIPDLEHRTLGMADGAGTRDKLGSASEKRVGTGGDHHTIHFALFDNAAPNRPHRRPSWSRAMIHR